MTALRTRLTFSALAAASSFIAISAPAYAQSVCVAAGATFNCTDGTVNATGTFAGSGSALVSTPQALSLASTGNLSVAASGTVNSTSTTPLDPAVNLVSTGNLGLTAGAGGALNAKASGNGPAVRLQSTGGTVDATLGTLSSANSFALAALSQQGTTVSTGNLVAHGVAAGVVAANNGPATLTVNGNVSNTSAADGLGIIAFAPNGDATANITGNVNVVAAGEVVGVTTVGVNATTKVGGTVTVSGTSPTSSAAILTVATNGLSSTSCGNINASGAGIGGINAAGTNVVIRCGNITTNGDRAVGVLAVANNSIDAIVGNVATNGIGSTGLSLTAAGPIAVTTGNISTLGANSAGLAIIGNTGNVTATTGNVTTAGAASDGLIATTTSGNIGIATGKVTATGAGSRGIVSASTTGNQTITMAGGQADGSVVFATAGTGAITVNATAPVTSTNGFGINAVGTTGTLIVNAAGANGKLGAINALDTGVGTVQVNATGGLATSATADAIRLATLGTATTTIASGASVQGQGAFDAIDTRGAQSNAVTVRGTLGVPANGTGYAVNATGGAASVNILSGGSVFGPLALTSNADTVTNGGTLTLVRTSDFGLGNDTLANIGGGTLFLNQDATVIGLESLNNAGTVVAAGTTNLGGATFNNLASGQLVATSGAATLAGVPVFNNAGLITMVDGATNDTLTLGGNYVGASGARLAVDVDGGLATADRLVVNGNISGVTTVSINPVGTQLYNPTGALVVDGTGTVSSGAFVLAPLNVQTGFLNYGLRQNGNDTFVVTSLDNSVTDLAMVGSIGRDLWYQSFDAYHDAIMGRHAGATTTGHAIGIWGQLYQSKDKYGSDGQSATIGGQNVSYSNRMETRRRGGQAGLEYRGAGWVLGVTGGYEWARTEKNPMVAQLGAEGHNYGAYALFGMGSGIYGGVMYKRDDFKVSFANDVRAVSFRNSAHSDGVDGELGFRGGTPAVAFDLNAGASYVKTHIDPWNQYGLNFDWNDNKSLRGRIGAQVIFPQAFGAFVGAKVFHEFKNEGSLLISNAGLVGDVALANRGTWVRVETGLNGSGTNGVLLTLWGDLGNTKGFGGRVGFRF